MELFKLFGTIALDNSGAMEGIDRTTDKAEKAHYKISQAFGKVGDVAIKAGKVVASGLAVGATAMASLAYKALQLGGGLEQNLGGSVAAFGDYAQEMQKKATEAFDKMGLSASDYLATANKMGALFQGAGFSAETSAEMTSRAMQRAADVASIMGIDIASAMEAIAGAAKGNFTMMDNLGVAMNDTSLQAYALSKGIETAVSDMSQQEKIGLAMEMFLEKTAYAAGNYAKENDTLAGSLSTAKAALSNFLSGAGDANSVVKALTNAGDVIVSNIKTLLPRLVEGLNTLMAGLLPYIPTILESLLPGVLEGAFALLTGLATILPELVQVGADLIASLANGAAENMPAIIAVASDVIRKLVQILTEEETLNKLFDASLAIILALAEGLVDFLPALIEACLTIVDSLVQFLLKPENLNKLIRASLVLIEALATGLLRSVGVLMDSARVLTSTFVEALMTVNWVQVGKDIVLGIAEGILNAWGSFVEEHPWAAGVLVDSVTSFANGGTNAWHGIGINGSHADGLNYVPYDGYIAELHKGEMVIPAAESMRIRAGVAQGNGLEQYFQRLIEMLADYFPRIVNGMDRPIEFNPNSMAAALAVPMNQELGRISVRKDRGR